MHIQKLVDWYQTKSNEELVTLAADLAQLTPEAQSALSGELARRRLQLAPQMVEQLSTAKTIPAQVALVGKPPRPYRTTTFIPDVLRVYHSQLWFFLKLIAPAVVGSYITVWYSRLLVHKMTELLFLTHKDSFYTMYPKLLLLGFTRYFISWTLFFFAFGAICVAISQIEAGDIPSLQRSFGEVWKAKKPFLQLCLLLFSFAFMAYEISGFMVAGLLWVCSHMEIYLT